jgi:hypothetical protein
MRQADLRVLEAKLISITRAKRPSLRKTERDIQNK